MRKTLIKTEQFLSYILKLYKHRTVFNLTHLSYLTDYLSFSLNNHTISNFRYKRCSFGPFDEIIFTCLENLVKTQLIKSHLNRTRTGLEYVSYAYSDRITDKKFKRDLMPDISAPEFRLMQEILYELLNYTDDQVTNMVFKARPSLCIN